MGVMIRMQTWVVMVSACPICSEPVTFGGGSIILNRPAAVVDDAAAADDAGVKKPGTPMHYQAES